ncbi:VirB3 family type IV secretion system protein [Sphingomonas sp.]|uniref:type IV secretion system protein VirB3 n=1 Tax=Sphingomonas sp. TaxID=28214 RepID=UPI0025F6F414|nr:VirB3 family type IV secretion system protein [Sphingomonas sp.]MBV9528437.1 VirB3 family type IV secretion system protein [Sphingomonas sp.]
MASDRLFRALARPQMVAGVTYPFFVLNGIVGAELFLIFKSLFALVPVFVIHGIGYAAHLRDPHIMSVWLTKLRRIPRVPNRNLWGANVYRP